LKSFLVDEFAAPNIMNPYKNIVSRLLATPCLACLAVPARHRGFCAACEEELPWQPPGCERCGVALTGVWPDDLSTTRFRPPAPLCSRCLHQAPVFDQCRCTFAYEPPVSDMIRRFKDNAGFAEYRALSNCFTEHFLSFHDDHRVPLPDLLVPVPLHASRLRARGFNQALLLARRLSRQTGIPVLADSCLRQAGTPQRGLNAEDRQHNMRGVFRPLTAPALTPGRHLAIIDDVVTTTATTQAMASVMRNYAATRIDVWALARSNHQTES
tara:strand:+ start:6734 stop:7540 length:807 start_codon:yes stop_codon:yes gene_type:complete